jgi:hypothetical protein
MGTDLPMTSPLSGAIVRGIRKVIFIRSRLLDSTGRAICAPVGSLGRRRTECQPDRRRLSATRQVASPRRFVRRPSPVRRRCTLAGSPASAWPQPAATFPLAWAGRGCSDAKSFHNASPGSTKSGSTRGNHVPRPSRGRSTADSFSNARPARQMAKNSFDRRRGRWIALPRRASGKVVVAAARRRLHSSRRTVGLGGLVALAWRRAPPHPI